LAAQQGSGNFDKQCMAPMRQTGTRSREVQGTLSSTDTTPVIVKCDIVKCRHLSHVTNDCRLELSSL